EIGGPPRWVDSGRAVERQAMIGDNRFEPGDPRNQGFPASGEPGKVVRYDPTGQDLHVGCAHAPVDEDGSPGARRPHPHDAVAVVTHVSEAANSPTDVGADQLRDIAFEMLFVRAVGE